MSSELPPPSHVRSSADSVHATLACDDDTVRVTSSYEFFRKQIRWCVDTLDHYWALCRSRNNGVWPDQVPRSVRFCLSWLIGTDCTGWTARQIHSWMHRRLGTDGNMGNVMTTVYMQCAYRFDPRQTDEVRLHVPTVLSCSSPPGLMPPCRTCIRPTGRDRGVPSPIVRARVTGASSAKEAKKENCKRINM